MLKTQPYNSFNTIPGPAGDLKGPKNKKALPLKGKASHWFTSKPR
jgi:hypothetical protein